jgi:uncharacterized membrane protein
METIITLTCRILHIAATCTSLGGLFYARMVTLPTANTLPAAEREIILSRMIKRFSYIKWTGVIVVVVTGVIQWFYTFPEVHMQDEKMYIGAFVLKMVGAIGLFTITFLLALPAEKLKGMQKNRAFWSALNIVCGLTILVGAALMRQVREAQ